MRDVARAIVELLERGERAALATVVRAAGSTPQIPGAKMLLRLDGGFVGTVGGGRIEEAVLEAMRATLEDGRTRVVAKHLAHDLGMCCGGNMEIFVEPVESRPPLVVFGAGHVAKWAARFAHDVGYDVTIVDSRADMNSEERFPFAQRVLFDPGEAIDRGLVRFGQDLSIVICTHDHTLDEEALRACAPQPRRYLGMIGSKRKAIRVLERVAARVPAESLADVRTPIGLDLGAVTPEEIGLSIASELVTARRGGSGAPMRIARGDEE